MPSTNSRKPFSVGTLLRSYAARKAAQLLIRHHVRMEAGDKFSGRQLRERARSDRSPTSGRLDQVAESLARAARHSLVISLAAGFPLLLSIVIAVCLVVSRLALPRGTAKLPRGHLHSAVPVGR